LSILIWNYHDEDVSAAEAEIRLEVQGIAAKSATVEEFRMDADHSNSYAAWQKMGSPAQATPQQQQKLEAAGALEQSVAAHAVLVEAGAASLTLKLPRQGVALVRLRW
jgi:xylan 1,4-beta-xylosidase